jgi:transposase
MHGKETPHRRHRTQIIGCLTGGMSVRTTANTLGISESTVHRVARENREEIDQARAERARQVAQELQDRALRAALRLDELLDSQNETTSLGAARTILSEAARWSEVALISERLAELEQRVALRMVG